MIKFELMASVQAKIPNDFWYRLDLNHLNPVFLFDDKIFKS